MPGSPHAAGELRLSTGRSLLYSAVIVLGFFAGVEALLWWIDPAPPLRPRLLLRAIDVDVELPFMRPDPELFWEPRPGFEGEFRGHLVRIDRLGLRGEELRIPKPAGRRRLVSFGDSITFGYGVGEADTYPARLGALLAERGVEVANAGVTGYTSHQVLGRLRRLLPGLGADVASFCVGWNDGTLRPVSDQVYAARLRSTRRVEGALGGWRLYRLLAGFYVRSRLQAEREARVREQPRVPLADYRRNLARIVGECRQRGVLPVFVRLPHRRLPGEPAPETPYESALAEVAAELEVALFPVGELGLDSRAADTGALFIDSLHLSPAGSEVMARQLARQLAELGVI
jgi:lysophospholipase L1-like esterase